MNRTVANLYVIGLFLLGVLIGALGMQVFDGLRTPPHVRPPQPPFERLAERLDLDASQRQEVETILERARENSDRMRVALREQFEQTRREIEAILTPEQREAFDRMEREFPRHLMRRPRQPFGKRHGGSPPPAEP